MADEDPAAARRIPGASRVERARDRQRLDVGQAGPIKRVDGTSQKRLHSPGVAERKIPDERHADCPRARFHGHANAQPSLDRIRRVLRLVEHRGQIGVPANAHDLHSHAIYRGLDLLWIVQATHIAEVGLLQPDLKDVVTVQGKHVMHEEAADRTERQAFDVRVLGQILPHAVRLAHRTAAEIPDRQRADFPGRGQIALLQRRRDAQDVGDVVETVRGVVRRQQRCCVDVRREQIADGVRVLGPIESMQHGPARVGRRDGRPVKLLFEPCRQTAVTGLIGMPRTLRGHGARLKFPHDLFPHLGAPGHLREIQCLERESGGPHPLVVTDHAVLVNDVASGGTGGTGRRRDNLKVAGLRHAPSE